MIRGQQWLIVLLVVVIIFGARRLPDLARSVGASAREFRRGVEEASEENTDAANPEPSQGS